MIPLSAAVRCLLATTVTHGSELAHTVCDDDGDRLAECLIYLLFVADAETGFVDVCRSSNDE